MELILVPISCNQEAVFNFFFFFFFDELYQYEEKERSKWHRFDGSPYVTPKITLFWTPQINQKPHHFSPNR
jgi:hypothetical protein